MSRHRKPGQQRRNAAPSPRVWHLTRARKLWLLLIAVALGAGIAGFCLVKRLWSADSQPPLAAPASSLRPEISALQEEAVQVVDGLRGDFPDSSDPLVLMGNLQDSLGNSARATECWQQSLDIDPQRADAYCGLGSLALRKGQYEQALGLWGKALEIRPEMADVRTLSARALMALGRPKEAAAALEREIQISPRASTSYFELGQAYRQLKEYQKAKLSYQAAVKIQPDYTNAYYGLALACEKDSRSTYDDVASARRAVAQTHSDAAQVYYGHGQVQKAQQHWQRAARLDPKDTACRMQLVKVYTQAGRYQEALRICEELRQIEPENATTYLNIAVLSARLNRLDDALLAVDRAIKLAPDNPAFQRARQLIQERKRRGELQ
jgi:tetratricopeptide (TPR) repeat protein